MPDIKELFEGLSEKPKGKRYVLEAELYFWAESDETALKQAEDFAEELRKDSDNQCKVVSVHDASTHKPRKIK